MMPPRMETSLRAALNSFAAAAAVTGGVYSAYVALAWLRYGHVGRRITGDGADPLLDRFIPDYEVSLRHENRVAAPADLVFREACETELTTSGSIRALFELRDLLLGGRPSAMEPPERLIASMKRIGWSVLAEIPHREIVLGAVTKPWEARPIFRQLSPDDFKKFNEPDYVKIAWTLRADQVTPGRSLFRTETRVVATDRGARAKFRSYWSFFSPGMIVIRWILLRHVRTQAEHLYDSMRPSAGVTDAA